MARNSLGSLIVTLGLNAAEFTTGLTKSEYEAKKFAESIDKGIKTAANLATIAISAMSTAAVAALAAVDQLAKQAGNFQDLAEKTGANAEALASFSVAAQVAGTDMNAVADASIKLTKNLTGVDDESKEAGAALKALGIPIKEFKQLKPEDQIEAVAKAMAGFDDGAGKVAVSLALFGKAGAQLLPFLKELAAEGGRQKILTDEQIKLADEYADKQARLKAELNLYAQVVATQVLPALNLFTKVSKDVIAEIIGIESAGNKLRNSTAITDFANNVVEALGFIISSGQGIGRVFQVVGETIAAGAAQTAAVARGDLKGAIAIGRDWQTQVDAILNKQLFSQKLSAQMRADAENARLNLADTFAGGNTPKGKQLTFTGAADKEKRAAAERTSEAERYLENLQRQIEATYEMTAVEKLLLDIQRGRLKGLNEGLSNRLFAAAEEIDANKELAKWIKETGKAHDEAVRAAEHDVREQAHNTRAAQDEAEHLKKSNEQLRDEIAIIVGGEGARDALEQARIADAIAIKEQTIATLQLKKGTEDEVDAIRASIDQLRERSELLKGRSEAKQMADDAKAIREAQEAVFDIGANALTDFITGTKSAKDALKSFLNDLNRFLIQQAFAGLKNSLFGSGGGTDIWSLIAKMFGGGLGGGGGFAGSSTFGSDGFGFGFGAMAGGGIARRGLALVGEQGPEIVSFGGGERVYPHGTGPKMDGGRAINVHVNVLPGATKASAKQAAAEMRDALVLSMRTR